MLTALKDRAVLSLILLLTVLVICNLTFAFSKGWWRWGWQLLAFASLYLVYRFADLSLADIGLSRDRLGSGLKYAAVTIVLILVGLVVAYFVKHSLFHDSRYHQSLGAAITAGLFVVPLKTVLFEELAFRGIMPAILKDIGSRPWIIFLVTALLFALWHMLTIPRSNDVSVGSFSNLLIAAVTFLTTFLGGLVFYYLRDKSGSLVAPILVHWLLNGTTIVLAALSWR
jgi:membrane protease YdiL (CAAX protease family)